VIQYYTKLNSNSENLQEILAIMLIMKIKSIIMREIRKMEERKIILLSIGKIKIKISIMRKVTMI
jgi:hypothetical protein